MNTDQPIDARPEEIDLSKLSIDQKYFVNQMQGYMMLVVMRDVILQLMKEKRADLPYDGKQIEEAYEKIKHQLTFQRSAIRQNLEQTIKEIPKL